jgi:hypothetical protein
VGGREIGDAAARRARPGWWTDRNATGEPILLSHFQRIAYGSYPSRPEGRASPFVYRPPPATASAPESAPLTLRSVQLSGLMQQACPTPKGWVPVAIGALVAIRDSAGGEACSRSTS